MTSAASGRPITTSSLLHLTAIAPRAAQTVDCRVRRSITVPVMTTRVAMPKITYSHAFGPGGSVPVNGSGGAVPVPVAARAQVTGTEVDTVAVTVVTEVPTVTGDEPVAMIVAMLPHVETVEKVVDASPVLPAV
jgi:hypothetical protein